MVCGGTTTDMDRKAATHVNRVLRGTKHAELPVQEPTKQARAANRKVAKTGSCGIAKPMALAVMASRNRAGSPTFCTGLSTG